jgi:hypothetical protein
VREMLTITATVDHRFVDGYQLGTLARAFRQVFEDPWSLEGKGKPEQLEGPASSPAPDTDSETARASGA